MIILNCTLKAIENLRVKENNRKHNKIFIEVIRNKKIVKVRSEKLLCGEIISIKENDIVPADSVVIYSSGDDGQCFIDTTSINGQNHFTKKNQIVSFEEIAETSPMDFIQNFIEKRIIFEKENNDLKNFKGTLEMKGKKFEVSINNFLPKESVLKNTDYVLAVIVYSG